MNKLSQNQDNSNLLDLEENLLLLNTYFSFLNKNISKSGKEKLIKTVNEIKNRVNNKLYVFFSVKEKIESNISSIKEKLIHNLKNEEVKRILKEETEVSNYIDNELINIFKINSNEIKLNKKESYIKSDKNLNNYFDEQNTNYWFKNTEIKNKVFRQAKVKDTIIKNSKRISKNEKYYFLFDNNKNFLKTLNYIEQIEKDKAWNLVFEICPPKMSLFEKLNFINGKQKAKQKIKDKYTITEYYESFTNENKYKFRSLIKESTGDLELNNIFKKAINSSVIHKNIKNSYNPNSLESIFYNLNDETQKKLKKKINLENRKDIEEIIKKTNK